MAKLSMLKPRVATLDTAIAQPPPKERAHHYGTREHKQWAADVERRAGGQCQDPEHQGSRGGQRGVADHIKELKDGGAPLDLANGMWRCWSCHSRKTVRMRAARATASASR